jgi:putative intracellular protease/amidase
MKILMVMTSHDTLGNTGFWLEEFCAPYYTFLDAGASVTVASPKGGEPPFDPKSDTPEGQTDLTRADLRMTPKRTPYWPARRNCPM